MFLCVNPSLKLYLSIAWLLASARIAVAALLPTILCLHRSALQYYLGKMAGERERRRPSNVFSYFSAIIVLFGCLSLGLNLHISREINLGNVQQFLMDSFTESFQAGFPQLGGYDGDEESPWGNLEDQDGGHRLSGLNCDAYGGPSEDAAQEMVYWRDIPSDSLYESPFKRKHGPKQYLTFEPDQGGWNNIRMVSTEVFSCLGRSHVKPIRSTCAMRSRERVWKQS